MKRKMKSMLASLAVMAVVFSAGAAPRQDKPKHSPEERAKFMVEKMAEKLDLTDLQKEQILDLHKEMAASRGERPERPARGEGERPSKEEMEKMRTEMGAKMAEHKAAMEAKMSGILTPEQMATWKEEMANHPRHHGPQARKHDRKDSPHGKRGKGERKAKGCECKSEA